MGERKTWKGKEREGEKKTIEEKARQIGIWRTRRKKRFSPEWGAGDLF